MSKKQTYTADQRIRHDGDLYKPGDELKLTPNEADRLHVTPAEDSGEETAPEVSSEGTAKEAIAMIEETPFAQLDGFVDENEDRKTVVDAWKEKQADEAETEENS